MNPTRPNRLYSRGNVPIAMAIPAPPHVVTGLIAAIAFLAMLFVFPQRAPGVEQFAATPAVAVRLPTAESALVPGKLPFTAGDAVRYFSTVLEMSPERDAEGATYFENQHVSHAEDRWTITVRTEGKEVVVEFRVGGDYGLSLAREFFESPLFVQEESEQLYVMLNEAQNAPTQRLPRFTLRMHLTQTTDLMTLTLRFTPHEAA